MNRRTAFCALSLVALFVVLATPHVLAASDQDYSHARIVRLSYVEGDVQAQRPEEVGWEEALLNLPIRQGYQISTRQGRAEIEFESGAVARLSDDTLLQFTELALAGGGRLTHLSLLRGTATFYANLSSDDRFTVTTPHFTVSVPRNARFRIDSGTDGATVSVQKGDVDVEALGAPYHVTKNRAFLFRVDGEQVTLVRAPDADAWDRWVENREEILNVSRQAVSTRYTRTAYTYGMYDLDYYGGWYNVAGYGRCWQPYSIPIGWSPYGFGRFIYLNGFGFTWVSFEPWGWAPYHFGHWVYLPGGWYWVPGGFSRWQPALVYWVNLGNNQWGWGPLHPHDRPGQPPVNLPNGTVVTTTSTPSGYGSVDRRNVRLTAAQMSSAQVTTEPPDSLSGERLRRRGAVAVVDGADTSSATGATSTTPAPSGYSGTTKTTRPGDVARDEGITPRAGRRDADAGTPSGIVYDPKQRRYVNSDVPGRAGSNTRRDSTDAPAAPARGYSGATSTPGATTTPPAPDVRRTDRGDVARDENRMPGRREQQDVTPSQVRSTQQPRSESQAQRPSSTPTPSPQPRMDAPRSAPPPPRMDSPRPASPPPQASPRMEPARPSPPASSPAPRSEAGGRPNTKPPNQ
ncbi:MAG TPA: DUF6600 domain-containing protein [Candidatus Acidoferrales bacterium]|nr:DUF6600 domain-containing protein [Candidatus Acidoferrales bacterium]